MSRNYANISTAIWRNEEFRALTVGAQHAYLLLTSQPDISAAGVLPLSIRRWSNQSAGATPATLVAALNELQDRRFIVFDLDTEELLVRSFVRWDGGHTNPKRRPVIQRAALDVESRDIRRSLAGEFRRLGLPDWLPDSLSGPVSGGPSESPSAAPSEPTAASIDADASSQGNSLSGTQSATQSPSDGVVVTVVTTYSPTHNPQTSAPPALPALPSGDGLTTGQRSKPITDAYHDAVGGLCNWPAINGIVTKAIKAARWPDDDIRAALLRLAADNRPVTTDTLRIELTGGTITRSSSMPKPSTSDQRVNAALALADELDAVLDVPALTGGIA